MSYDDRRRRDDAEQARRRIMHEDDGWRRLDDDDAQRRRRDLDDEERHRLREDYECERLRAAALRQCADIQNEPGPGASDRPQSKRASHPIVLRPWIPVRNVRRLATAWLVFIAFLLIAQHVAWMR